MVALKSTHDVGAAGTTTLAAPAGARFTENAGGATLCTGAAGPTLSVVESLRAV